MADVQSRLGRLEVEMDMVQEGVANFKGFQKDMREFVTEFKTNERNKKATDARRSKIHYFLLSILSGLIVGLFVFLLNHYDGRKVSIFTAPEKPDVILSQPQDAHIPPIAR